MPTHKGRVPDAVIQAIRDSVQLSELVGRTVVLRREGREHVGLCPFHEERTPSFKVNDSKGFFHCFSCGSHGDAVDFVRHVYKLTFPEAVSSLARENGLAGTTPQLDPAASARADERRRGEEERARRNLEAAQRIWHEALPIEDSPAERYLRSRAITGPLPASLRYHPELRYRVNDKTWIVLPAMVAQVARLDLDPTATIAVHRTYILRDGSGKAEVDKPKSLLGEAGGGGVWLGSESVSLLNSTSVNVCEGIETALSLQLLNCQPTIAALSTGGMVPLQLPRLPAARQVTIGADNDKNDAGLRAALSVATRWRDEGRDVHIETPREVKDWNDHLRARGPRCPTP